MADDYMSLYLLHEYRRIGLYTRIAFVNMFMGALEKNLSSDTVEDSNERFNISADEKDAAVQVGAVAHIMMLTEDMAVLCQSFLNDDIDYYQYLDRKGEEDLGNIIGQFYNQIDTLTNENLRKILSYVDPDKFEFKNEEDRNFVKTIMVRDFYLAKYFLTKVFVFWENHIGVFRRYKHAGFPILFGNKIPPSDDLLYKKFDFATFALTSRENAENEVTVLPFSIKVLESYQYLLVDMFTFLNDTIKSRLICVERKLDGVLPSYAEHFRKLSQEEKIRLSNLWKDFEEKHPKPGDTWEREAIPLAKHKAWYVHLESHYVKSVLYPEENTL